MKRHFPNYKFDNEAESDSARKIDGFVEEIVEFDENLTDEKFLKLMDKFIPIVDIYVQLKALEGFRLNPFTITRHVLFWHDRSKYGNIIWSAQKQSFESWKKSKAEVGTD